MKRFTRSLHYFFSAFLNACLLSFALTFLLVSADWGLNRSLSFWV